jgi:hypothetical protein
MPLQPQGAVPSFDAMPDDSQPVSAAQGTPQGLPSFDQMPEDGEVQPTTGETSRGQQIKAGLEGFAKGVVGPIAPWVERRLYHVPAGDIAGREKEYPWTSGLSQTAGLIAPTLLSGGMSEAAHHALSLGEITPEAAAGTSQLAQLARFGTMSGLMDAGGEAVARAVGLGAPASYTARVGSEAVRQAVQMAILQSGDEVSKQVLNDPETSSESALANVGMAAAIGGGIGGILAGAVNPLWKATFGPKLEEFLKAHNIHMNGPEVTTVKDYSGVQPESAPGENIRHLVHYSSEPRDVIDPKFAGTGVDSGVRGRELKNPLAHYYEESAEPEKLVTARMPYKHTVTVDTAKQPIYDFAEDPLKVLDAVKTKNNGAFNLDDASDILKQHGFAGFTNTKNLDNPGHVAMFQPLPVSKLNDMPLGVNPDIRNIASEYAKAHGQAVSHDLPPISVNPERSAAIAQAYEKMAHNPTDPKVKKAYDALMQETMDQYQYVKKLGLNIESIKPGQPNPYPNSAAMRNDIKNNKHLWFFPTSQGFGQVDSLPKNFSLISSQVGDKADNVAQKSLAEDLQKAGMKTTAAQGNYGSVPEPSMMVEHNGSPEAKAAIDQLGHKYGQESVIHTDSGPNGRVNELRFMDKRPSLFGQGAEQNSAAQANFTETPQHGKFQLQLGQKDEGDHPLLQYTNEMIDGKPAQANDIFRIVHDVFGHAKEGNGFGPKGEEQAWRQHMQMFSPDAQKALTTETRGQNSWVNFGPKGAQNRANPSDTVFAQQKAGLMPDWTTSTELRDKIPQTVITAKPHHIALKEAALEGRDEALYHGMNMALESDEDGSTPIEKALRVLDNMPMIPLLKAVANQDPKAVQVFNELREAQNPKVLSAIRDHQQAVNQVLLQKLDTDVNDLAHYSRADAGNDAKTSFQDEYKQKYEPIAAGLEKRNEQAKHITMPYEARRDFMGSITERGMRDVGTDSPEYKIYEDYAKRVLAKVDVAGIDQLKTELNGKASSMKYDNQEKLAFRNIRNMITDFQETQIQNSFMNDAANLARTQGADANAIISQRAAINKKYADFAKMSDNLQDHLSIGDFKGYGTLKQKINDMSPEDLMKKFNPRGNAESIPFLQKNFPNTFSKVQELDRKQYLAPAVTNKNGENQLDVNKLSNILSRTLKGEPEYANYALPPGGVEAIQAAKTAMDVVPPIKTSGTAGWMSKLTRFMPASATAAVGLAMGHNPVAGYLMGELAQRLGKDVPEALKLSYLKYLGSPKPVQAEGFKAMVDLAHNAMKGQRMLQKATEGVFKAGQLATVKALSSADDRAKLDKNVQKFTDNPEKFMQQAQSSQLGYYMEQHQAAVVKSTAASVQYLASLKPHPREVGPLNKPMEPSQMEVSRYNRALDIANNPTVILSHIKDGTLKPSDIQDMQAMYPALRIQLAKQLTQEMIQAKDNGTMIPYATKMGLSLFLGQAVDQSMTPLSIMSAQPVPQQPQQSQPQGKTKRGTSTLGKSNKSYMTPSQSAEADRSGRE